VRARTHSTHTAAAALRVPLPQSRGVAEQLQRSNETTPLLAVKGSRAPWR